MSQPLETRIIECLNARGHTAVTAESCTGGLIGHRLTNVSGASACYAGGIIAYSNGVKETLLAVPRAILEAHGAVSDAVARAMAEGARKALGADYAVAVTGIAGPTGGTPEKPVGLVYIGTAKNGETRVTENRFQGTRDEIKNQTAETALTQLLEWLS